MSLRPLCSVKPLQGWLCIQFVLGQSVDGILFWANWKGSRAISLSQVTSPWAMGGLRFSVCFLCSLYSGLLQKVSCFLASTPPHDGSMRAPFLIPTEISSAALVASSHKKPEGHYKVSCRTAVGKMANTAAEIHTTAHALEVYTRNYTEERKKRGNWRRRNAKYRKERTGGKIRISIIWFCYLWFCLTMMSIC